MAADEITDVAVEDRPGGPTKAVDWHREWDALAADRRMRRFKRNVHYVGSPERLMRRAHEAAHERDRSAVVQREQIGRWEYLWVQFLDGEVAAGEPCPRCGGTEFHQIQEYFLRCVACHVLYPAPSDAGGPAAPDIVEFAGLVVRTLDGEPVSEMTIHDEAVVEASWHFLRPVGSVQAGFTFASEGRKALRSGCPDVVDISRPQTVRFALHVDERVLAPDVYEITPSLDFELEPDDRGGEPRSYNVSGGSGKASLTVVAPGSESRRLHSGAERSRLHWNVSILADDDAAPLRRPDVSELVQFEEIVVRSPDGRAIQAVDLDEPVLIDMSWRFLRPANNVFPTVILSVGSRKALRVAAPEVVVAEPQLVRFRLALDERVLEPGVYSLDARLDFTFKTDSAQRHVYEVKTREVGRLEVRDRRPAEAISPGDRPATRLRWSIDSETGPLPPAAG